MVILIFFFSPITFACLFKEGFEEKPGKQAVKDWNVKHLGTKHSFGNSLGHQHSFGNVHKTGFTWKAQKG